MRRIGAGMLVGAVVGATALGALIVWPKHYLPAAQATHLTPLPTNTPGGPTETPTPAPNGLGTLSGVYDVLVHDGQERAGYFHCILRLDHDSSTNKIGTAAQCYADVNIGDPNAEPPAGPPGEGPDGLPGPPPPLPYVVSAPSVGVGDYKASADELLLAVCFSNMGGPFGPNILALVDVPVATAQLSVNGKMNGQVALYARQGIVQCGSLAPAGSYTQLHAISFHPIIDVNGAGPNRPAPWRTLGDLDFDHDGCSDANELRTAIGGAPSCGDDPYNPLDSSSASPPDIGGGYTMLWTAARADACWSGMSASGPCTGADGSLIPGSYHHCLADLQQGGAVLSARTYCYIDAPGIAVNPQVAGATTCPPALVNQCGDGLPGAAPPGATVAGGPVLFGDIDSKHTVLTGALSGGSLVLSGCFEDQDGFAAQGNVYVSVVLDAYTGHGTASISSQQALGDCRNGTPAGAPTLARVDAVRQAASAVNRDTDQDGCPDKRELSDNPTQGGLRDPLNRWDFFDPEKVNTLHHQTAADILRVVQQFGKGLGHPAYTVDTDRTGLFGGNPWNLGPPDGLQTAVDILAAVKQFGHDCV